MSLSKPSPRAARRFGFVPGFGLALALTMAAAALGAGEQTWKINLKNADLREFIAQISTISGRSFILDPRVAGKVTVISGTPLSAEASYELLLGVLRVHGFAAVPGENAVRIVQLPLAKQNDGEARSDGAAQGETLITRVLPVQHTRAAELLKSLRPLTPQYGHMAALDTPNVLIISDHARNLPRLMEIIARIDVADTNEIQLIPLQHVWVNDLVSLLESLAPEHIGKGATGPTRVRVVAHERTNTLVLRGGRISLERMRDLIAELDRPAARANSTEVIRLAHSDAAELAELLENMTRDDTDSPLTSAQTSARTSARIQADESLNALVIRAEPGVMAELKSIIAELDVRRIQVLIEAAIVEVTTNFDRQLGTELAVADRSGSGLPVAVTAPGGTLVRILQDLADNNELNTPLTGDAPIFGVGKRSENGVNFALLLRALAENRDAHLLSTPSILTLDNEEAKITVGQNVPFRTGSTVTGSSGVVNPFTTIQRQDVGVTLQVTPQVQDDQLVRLSVHQEVSEVDLGSIGIGVQGASDLITQKRTINTTVLADDGEVVILGGLIRDNIITGTTRVPVLGRVPLLGRLFRSDSRRLEKRNLLVFLRPTILTNREETAEVSKRKYNSVREIVIEGVSTEESLQQLLDGVAPRPER